MQNNKNLFNILILIISISVTLGILEGFIRIMGFEGEQYRQKVVFDERYDKIYVKSWFHNAKFDGPEPFVDIRGQVIPFEKPKDETRILFIGDSGTFGAGLALQHAFPAQFQAILDKENIKNVKVINAGLTGTDQITQYNILKDKLLKLKPDLVVLGIFMANDITDNLLRVQGLEKQNIYSIVNTFRFNSALFNFIYLRLQVLNAKYKIFDHKKESYEYNVNPIDEDGIHLMNQYWGEIATYKQPQSKTINFAFTTMESALQKFKQLGLVHDFQFSVNFIPTYSQVTNQFEIIKRPKEFSNLQASGVKIEKSDLDVQSPIKRILSICSKVEILCMDPSEVHRPYGKDAFIKNDDHLSGIGAKLQAQFMYQFFDKQTLRFTKPSKSN